MSAKLSKRRIRRFLARMNRAMKRHKRGFEKFCDAMTGHRQAEGLLNGESDPKDYPALVAEIQRER